MQQDRSQTVATDDFRLTAAQMVFMINAEDSIKQAEAEGDDKFFHDLVESEEYKALFGNMSIDQVIDRYELMSV